MKKSILNLGKSLNTSQLKNIQGGYHPPYCYKDSDCGDNMICIGYCVLR